MAEWEMTFSGPLICLATEYGSVYVVWTHAGHCHVSTDSWRYSGENYAITYRRNQYRVASLHLWAASDWSEDPRDPAVSNHRTEFAPPSYQKAITEAISASVREYVAAHPAILPAADVNDAQNELTRALKEEDEISTQLRAAFTRTLTVRGRLAAARAELDRYS
jgi:hypothetical protein